MSDTVNLSEIYLSVQGESTFAGLPCVFIRLAACNLRCSYCDTAYAFTGGEKHSIASILDRVHHLALPFRTAQRQKLPLVELTGGEPLLQPNVLPLMCELCDRGFTVLLETSGALEISRVDSRVHRIMDLKCPSSGEVARNRWENISHLNERDEVKFVIGTAEDYAWAKNALQEHHLAQRCSVLFSWVAPLLPHQQDKSLKPVPAGQTPISRLQLVEQLTADALPVRFQLQMHKFIWPSDAKGV